MGVVPGATTLGLEKITKRNLSTPEGVHQLHTCYMHVHVNSMSNSLVPNRGIFLKLFNLMYMYMYMYMKYYMYNVHVR